MKSKLFRILGVVAVVAMIATALVAPVSALTGVNLAVSLGTGATGAATDISNTPITYTVTFTPGAAQVAATNAVVVTFDAGIKLPTSPFTVTFLTNGPGIGGGTAITTPTYAGATAVGQVVTIDTSTVTAPSLVAVGALGNGAIVQITFTGVTNPATIGSYGVTVKTNVETTGVYSNTITTTNPTVAPVAGVCTVYNTAGTAVFATNDFGAALAKVLSTYPGGKIALTAGTYTPGTAFGLATLNTASVTIQGIVGSASSVVLIASGPWGLGGATVTIDSVTIDNTNGTFTMNNATAGTVSNCTFKNAASGVAALTESGTGTNTVYGDTFTVKAGATGISASNPITVTASTLTMAGSTTANGLAINSSANVTVSGATFIGTASTATPPNTGNGIALTGGPASVIGTSIFTGLSNALSVTSPAAVAFSGNTVTSCGMTAGPDAITVTSTAGTGVTVTNNKISSSLEYIIYVAANDTLVTVMDNQFATNVKNAWDNVASGTLNVTHNYWGATPPAASVTTGTATVSYANPLGIAPTAGNFVTGTTMTASTTAGVNVVASTGATYVGAAALSGNPVAVALPSTATVVRYYDAFASSGVTAATVDFFGTTASPVTANSSIYFYNSAYGTWQPCSNQAINVYGNDVEITIGTTTAPTNVQFQGTPFVLVTLPTAPPAAIGTPTYPGNGATSVPVNAANLTFTWPVVAGTGISYQFALAQASANTTANEFAILDYSDNTITNAEPLQETLQYNTVYWWEVRAVTTNSSGGVATMGPWTVSMFTTAVAPVTTTGGTGTVVTTVVTSVVITNPVTTVVSTSTNIVLPSNTGTSSPAIPSYLLWAVIAVGAVLIIAVIVLIVRTRRIP